MRKRRLSAKMVNIAFMMISMYILAIIPASVRVRMVI